MSKRTKNPIVRLLAALLHPVVMEVNRQVAAHSMLTEVRRHLGAVD